VIHYNVTHFSTILVLLGSLSLCPWLLPQHTIQHPARSDVLPAAAAWQKFKESCQWSLAGAKLDLIYSWQSYDEDDNSTLEASNFEQLYCKDGMWIAFDIGPYTTFGGNSWSGMGALVNTSILHLHNDLLFVQNYVLGNVDEGGNLVGYPPIHQHHWHFSDAGRFANQEANNHADSQCHRSEGGVNCLAREAAIGYAWVYNPRIVLWTEFNDVRPFGSLPLSTHVYCAFKMFEPNKLTRQLREFDVFFVEFKLMHHIPRGTYEIRTDQESFGWHLQRLPDELQDIKESYMHTHPVGIRDMWVFQGSPEMVFGSCFNYTQMQVHYGAGITTLVAERIRFRMKQSKSARLACSYKDRAPEHICFEGVCADYFRYHQCKFEATLKEVVTVVLHRRGRIGPYRMHAVTRIYYSGPAGHTRVHKDGGLSREELIFSLRGHANPSRDIPILAERDPSVVSRFKAYDVSIDVSI